METIIKILFYTALVFLFFRPRTKEEWKKHFEIEEYHKKHPN